MTKEQKIEAYAMLLDGCTLQEIGDKFGVSRQRIQQIFPNNRCENFNYIYPNIVRWMRENRVPAARFAESVGVVAGTFSTWMRGLYDPKKYYIDRILAITGMTYEEAFSETETTTTKEDLVATLRGELCLCCGKYKQAHLGACDGCRWKEVCG